MKRWETTKAVGRIAPLPASETTSAAERELVRLLARQAAAEYVAALRAARDAV